MPRYQPALPFLSEEATALWVTVVPQVWRDDVAYDTDSGPEACAWDAAPYVATLPLAQQVHFFEGAGKDRAAYIDADEENEANESIDPVEGYALNHGTFDYEDLLFDDPHGSEAMKAWLKEGAELGQERTYRVSVSFQFFPEPEALAWRQAVVEDWQRQVAAKREATLEAQPTGMTRRPRPRS